MARMAEALQKTLNSLRALAGDHRSGAAEIADRAAALLAEFCRREGTGDPRLPYALSELADATLAVQPSMAPLLNLANRLQLAAEENGASLGRLRVGLEKFRRQRQQAVARIAREFAAHLPRRRDHRLTVLTYSYSSTVLAALAYARRRLKRVILSEGRPIYEGRLMAERLAGQGIAVTLFLDAALPAQVKSADAVVVGADAVLQSRYVSKVGTGLFQEEARRARKPFFVLADTSKFLPPALEALHRIEDRPSNEVWRGAPAGVTLVNWNFEFIPLERHVTLLSERGVLPPARGRAWAERLPVARRWREVGQAGKP